MSERETETTPIPHGVAIPEAETLATGDDVQTQVERAFEEIEVDSPLVGIIMGSPNDKPKMQPAGKALHEAGISYEVRVMSAHRTPDKVADYCRNAQMRGLKVIIAGAGLSAALPGVVAAHTDLPVIGVPLTSSTSVAGGLDVGLGDRRGGFGHARHDCSFACRAMSWRS